MVFKPLAGRPHGIYWYVLQTNTAAEVAFNRYWELLRTSNLLHGKPNESEKFVTLINGAVIHFKSGEVLDNLRAETLDGCIIDEFRQQHPSLWTSIINPMLKRRHAWCDFYSTPNGFEHFYDLFERAKVTKNWAAFHAPSTEAPWWTEEEIEESRSSMSTAEFDQEILAEFRDMSSGRVYMNYHAANDRPTSPFAGPTDEYSQFLPVCVFMDFNISPMAWTIGQVRGADMHLSDEVYIERISDPFEPARNLIAKLKRLPFDVTKNGIWIVGDASGKANQRTSMQSDYDIVCQELDAARIKWINKTPDSNPSIKDRINTVNARLKDANGQVHLTLNPARCPMLKRDLQRVLWKKTEVLALDSGPNRDLTHSSDGVGYGVCALAPLVKPASVGTMRVIVR